MNRMKKYCVETCKWTTASAVLAVLVVGSGVTGLAAHNLTSATTTETQLEKTQSKFYCNIKALTPAERAHHAQLTEQLMASRKEIVETAKGYEFQFSPKIVTLAELADWVSAESKCCPFFDFHIDLEEEGGLLCLRLTGEEGVKPFIRMEFQIAAK
jgi:hypothetical protein